ncbi:MAG: DUF692 domain-containing protein [Chloroflexota bacterium]|nr:DUF692 domain-containing protein [Chloroflexota bacterium]
MTGKGQTPQLELGCNYSPQLVSLLHHGRVNVEWIKLSRWSVLAEELAVARPLRPVLLHVLPRAGMPPDALPSLPWTWDEMNEATQACGSPHAALHLASRTTDWDAAPTDVEVVERMVKLTALFARKLSAPLLVENVPYFAHWDTLLRRPTDPEAIWEVCERTEVGLLLDLAHARVAAYHRGEDVRAYVGALPLHLVREVHVSGPGMNPEKGLRDRHQEMQQDDYNLLEWVLERSAPRVVALEYGGTGPLFEWRSDAVSLERQLRQLRRICGG